MQFSTSIYQKEGPRLEGKTLKGHSRYIVHCFGKLDPLLQVKAHQGHAKFATGHTIN